MPMEGMKDCTYCPYSNRQYAMLQFNPIFVSKNSAISFMSEKLEQDRSYLMSRLTSVSRKRALLQYYIEGRMISTTTRRSRGQYSLIVLLFHSKIVSELEYSFDCIPLEGYCPLVYRHYDGFWSHRRGLIPRATLFCLEYEVQVLWGN